jgi:Uma2 family endonuclease
MSTIANRRRPDAAVPGHGQAITNFGNQRIVIRGVGRQVYDVLDEAIGEGQHIRLAYDGKDLELMTTSELHEFFKQLFSEIVGALVEALEIDRIAVGEKTWKTKDMGRGLQADLSYYFDPEKLRMARDGLKRRSMDPADFPTAPDLAIEIDASRPKVDRPSVYAELRALEVWRFDGVQVKIEQLQPVTTNVNIPISRFLPVSGEDICRWLLDDDATLGLVWKRRLRQRARRLRRRA